MPPPFYRLGIKLRTQVEVSARICLKRGYEKTSLSLGQYLVTEIARNEKYWHVQELSDGYTYRLKALDKDNPLYGKRISVWQNDLVNSVAGVEED